MQMNPSITERAFGLSEAERVGAVLAAAALVGYGAKREPIPRFLFTAAAVPLAYRAIVGRWPSFADTSDDTREALSGSRGTHVRESVRIEKPVTELYRMWRTLETLPTFMRHVRSVEPMGDRRSHWVANGPGGLKVEWDAEIINEVENETIGWRSLPGADVVSAGSVNFKPVRGGEETQVSVHLQYAPPAGSVGSYAAMLLGREPSQMIREDLRRLKQICEAGEIPRAVPPEQQGIY
jgi:uncharacterized membrane protein